MSMRNLNVKNLTVITLVTRVNFLISALPSTICNLRFGTSFIILLIITEKCYCPRK